MSNTETKTSSCACNTCSDGKCECSTTSKTASCQCHECKCSSKQEQVKTCKCGEKCGCEKGNCKC